MNGMIAPQPFQYQGSKRALASVILQYLPAKTQRIVEPFAGSAALSIACAARGAAKSFWVNDYNKPLAELLGMIINNPDDYRDVLVNCMESDVVYMDPPCQGVCGERDSRYFSGISLDEFIASLQELNERNSMYLISYDGRLGDKAYGIPLPDWLDLTLVEIEAGRSTQATFLGRQDVTFESLYLSKPLARMVKASSCTRYRNQTLQMQLLEAPSKYEKAPKRIS